MPPPPRDDFYQEIGRRIRAAIEEDGITQKYMAERLGMSTGGFNQWVTGARRITISELTKVALELRRPLDYFLEAGYGLRATSEARTETADELIREGLARMPLILPIEDAYIGTPPPVGGTEPRHSYLPDPTERGHRIRIFRVAGDCLVPDIHPGDKVLVDLDRTPTEGDIVAVTYEKTVLVKRLGGPPDGWRLIGNDGRVVTPSQDIVVIGVVLEVGRRLVEPIDPNG